MITATLLSADDVAAFGLRVDELMQACCSWDLWAVAYIMLGGCSDDCFDYFRGWLICQGRHYFEASLADPERAADAPTDDVMDGEALLAVPREVYQRKTGTEPPFGSLGGEPQGKPFREDDKSLQKRFPRAWKKFNA